MLYINKDWVKQQIPKRRATAHKGNFGTLTVVAGSNCYRGAALLAVHAALRAGAGIVRLASTEAVCAAAVQSQPCCILLPLPQQEGGISGQSAPLVLAQKSTALLVGCGLGNGAETAALVRQLLQGAPCPLLLDADALNVLAGHAAANGQQDAGFLPLLQSAGQPVVVTPHVGEMARLCGLSPAGVQQNQARVAADFAARHHCTVVLKSYQTVVSAPGGELYMLQNSNPGLAKGGSGDVLAGIIASLMAQGLAPATAAAAGVWLHGRAGQLAAGQMGQAGLSPAELPLYLGRVWRELDR